MTPEGDAYAQRLAEFTEQVVLKPRPEPGPEPGPEREHKSRAPTREHESRTHTEPTLGDHKE